MGPINTMFSISVCFVIVLLSFTDCQICTKDVHLRRWTRQSYMQTYRESYYGQCYYPCIKYRTRSYRAMKNMPTTVVEKRQECCDGYLQTESDSTEIKCEPICSPSCTDGYCKSPGQCACHDGYQLVHSACFPICDNNCEHGVCIEPNECACHFGYQLQNGTCVPHCTEPCVNAVCTAPGTCECLDGYRKSENDLCLPYCQSGCDHGTCVSPENCNCDEGWHKSQHDNVCLPLCEYDCGGGRCVAPNVCECYTYFEKSENGSCIPVCSGGCLHGTCIHPDTCKCDVGWRKNDSDLCVPVCDLDCGEGSTCVAPNDCECHPGYEKSGNGTCTPHCSNVCTHGRCTSPENCTCDVGWQKNEDDVCIQIPICDSDCGKGGTCISANVCKCMTNYELTNNGTCAPYCSNGCPNGTCVEPEVCQCQEGWSKNYLNECKPYCNKICGNGTCIAPDECQCFDGYKINEDNVFNFFNDSLCIPDCKGCNGTCSAPGLCRCDTPFEAKLVSRNGGECNCSTNCSDNSVQCDYMVCVFKDNDWDTTTTDANTIYSTKLYNHSIHYSENDAITDEPSMNGTNAYTEKLNVDDSVLREINNTDQNKSSSLMNSKNNNWPPYWVYITASVLILTVVLAVVLFVKRKALSRFYTGGTYRVEDTALDLSSSL